MRKSKLYSLLLSVIVAFGLRAYVVTNVSTEDDITFNNIQVDMVGESVLNEQNLMITGVSSQTVSLHLSGSRSDLNKVNSDNITIKIDLAQIKGPGENIELNYNISFPGDVPSNAFIVESRSPASIFVDVDYRRTKDIPVQVKWTGTRSEDYIYDTENAVLDYPMITVVGPAAVADLIDHAEIEVDLTERLESLSESYRYTLCDAEGNPVDAEQITTSVEEVRLDLKIQRIKEVQLLAEVVYGGGATEQTATVTVEPSTIRLSGSDAVLAELGDTITLCTVNLSEIDKATDQTYTISLPEGVTNQTGVTEATVSIRFNGLTTREFTIEDIQSLNVPEGMTADIINAMLTVKVRGPSAEIALLEAEDISVTVDFANAEAGTATYKATIVINESFPNVGAVGPHSVSATVQSAEG